MSVFAFAHLDTEIREDGIYFRFFPYHWQKKRIGWDRITEANIRVYRPLQEFGGWGLGYGLFGKGRAYNISGNKGLQIVFDNGRKLLIGTQKPQELEIVLKKMGYLTAPK